MSLAPSEADRASPDRASWGEASSSSEVGAPRLSRRSQQRGKHLRAFTQAYSGPATSCEASGGWLSLDSVRVPLLR